MSNPCYYCELPKPQTCKVCIHGEADSEDLQKSADRIAELERKNAELVAALKTDEHTTTLLAVIREGIENVLKYPMATMLEFEKCLRSALVVLSAIEAGRASIHPAPAAAEQKGGE